MARVREVTYGDVGGVADLCRSVGWTPPSLEAWQRLWRDNPALSGVDPAPLRGWVLEHESRAVGFMCNLVQDYYLGDRPLKAATASAMVVAPEFRGETMKLVMAFAQQPVVDLLLNTTAAPQTSKIFEFFKFRRMPQPGYDTSLFWVLRPTRFLSVALRKKGWSAALSRTMGMLLGPGLIAEMAVRRRRLSARGTNLRIAVVAASETGDAFDELWLRRRSEGRRLLAQRRAADLKWHYRASRPSSAARLVCAYDGERLAGFCALTRADSPHIGLERAYVSDIFVERDAAEIIRPLLAASARHAHAHGAAMIEAVGFPEPVRRLLLEYHPYKLVNPCWPFLYSARDPEVHRALEDPALWHACLYDGDGSI
jgi:hypothetical protein